MRDIRKLLKIKENRPVSTRTRELKLTGDLGDFSETGVAGQFVNIEIPGKYLRRPISVNRLYKSNEHLQEDQELVLLYNVAGEGTRILSEMKAGECLDVLVGLGNGFSIPEEIKKPILLGGGIGAAPLMQLAVELVENGKMPQVVIGYNTIDESWGMEKELRDLGIATYVATMDGSAGTKGFVTDAIKSENLDFDFFYACGPMPMLKALSSLPTEGQLSLECRMGCGFGACMCCSLQTKSGSKRICKDGPVFSKNELIWK